MKISLIKTKAPFSDLFPIDPSILSAIKEHIGLHGYDESQPIIIWGEEGVVVDGHTRLLAAQEMGLEEVPTCSKSFPDEDSALKYAIHNQRDRRSLTSADIIRLVAAMDERRKAGRPSEKLASGDANLSKKRKSADLTAETIGVSQATVERVRTILDHAPPGIKEAVQKNQKSIKAAYTETQEVRKEAPKSDAKSVFNRQTGESIEWARWSWNPVTGCKHGCTYCYARDIATRFPEHYPKGFNPHFRQHRLTAPENTPIPNSKKLVDRLVFTVSMGDLFGEWVPQGWIDSVLTAVRNAPPWWIFLFLTKNPKRYLTIDFPGNCWIGATADTQARADEAVEALAAIQPRPAVLFISCEPLQEKIVFGPGVAHIDWLIIGGERVPGQAEAKQPPWEWVEFLFLQARQAGIKVYFKPNLTVRPKEYPEPGEEVAPPAVQDIEEEGEKSRLPGAGDGRPRYHKSTGELDLSPAQIGDPESADRAASVPGESGNDEQVLIQCCLCQQFVPSPVKTGGAGTCRLYPNFSWNGMALISPNELHRCEHFNLDEAAEPSSEAIAEKPRPQMMVAATALEEQPSD